MHLCSGFGQNGPYKDRAGYDVIAASIGGLMHITGPEVRIIMYYNQARGTILRIKLQ